MSTASDLTQQAKDEFLKKNANLLALTKNGANDVFKRISASLALDEGARADVEFLMDTIDQKGHAGQIARADFKSEVYKQICRSFLRVQRNAVILFVARLTAEAEAELDGIEVAAGERQPAPPPPPQKSPQELLDEEVRSDWKTLRTDKLKLKLNNRDYKNAFDRLMAANELESIATTYTDGLAEFRK
jgi:hypothetical protein